MRIHHVPVDNPTCEHPSTSLRSNPPAHSGRLFFSWLALGSVLCSIQPSVEAASAQPQGAKQTCAQAGSAPGSSVLSPAQWVQLEQRLSSYRVEQLQQDPERALEVLREVSTVLTPAQRQALGVQAPAELVLDPLFVERTSSTVYPAMCRMLTSVAYGLTMGATGVCQGSLYADSEENLNSNATSAHDWSKDCSPMNTDACLWASSYDLGIVYFIATEFYGYTNCRLYTPPLLVGYAAFLACGSNTL